jgi:hypothetical protein
MAAAETPLNGISATGAPLNGNHPPLVESLLQALNKLIERLNNSEITVEPERARETETPTPTEKEP